MTLVLFLGAALAGGPFDSEFRSPYPEPHQLSPGTYVGQFDRAPVPHWQDRLPGGRLSSAAHTERARPVIVGDQILMGSAAGNALYLLDRRDGRVVRSYPASASVESEPVVLGDKVWFTDTGGRTWCYTLGGLELWSHDSKAPILVQPTLHDGVVYVTNVDDLVVALDADSGDLQWRYQQKSELTRDAALSLYAAPPAVVVDDEVLVGFSDGTLVALSRATGDPKWSAVVGQGTYPDLVAAPSLWRDLVFASGYFEPLLAIDRETRKARWELPHGAAATPLLEASDPDDATLYHPGTDGVLRALVAGSGDEKWSWTAEKDGGALTSPVLTEAGLVVGSTVGTITLLDPASGQPIWSYRPPLNLEGIAVAPVIDGRQLLFVTNAGMLYSFLAPNGFKPWPRLGESMRQKKARKGKRVEDVGAPQAPSPKAEPGPVP